MRMYERLKASVSFTAVHAHFDYLLKPASPDASPVSLHWKSLVFLSSLTIVSAELNLHIAMGFLPTASHMLSTLLPSPQCFAVSVLLGSMNGARIGQAACAASQKISVPTLPMPLISCRRARTLVGEESARLSRLLRSPSNTQCQLICEHAGITVTNHILLPRIQLIRQVQ